MEQYIVSIAGTASYCGLDTDQHSSTEKESRYEIADILGSVADFHSIILPEKEYRVVAGRLYVVRPGSPPSIHP